MDDLLNSVSFSNASNPHNAWGSENISNSNSAIPSITNDVSFSMEASVWKENALNLDTFNLKDINEKLDYTFGVVKPPKRISLASKDYIGITATSETNFRQLIRLGYNEKSLGELKQGTISRLLKEHMTLWNQERSNVNRKSNVLFCWSTAYQKQKRKTASYTNSPVTPPINDKNILLPEQSPLSNFSTTKISSINVPSDILDFSNLSSNEIPKDYSSSTALLNNTVAVKQDHKLSANTFLSSPVKLIERESNSCSTISINKEDEVVPKSPLSLDRKKVDEVEEHSSIAKLDSEEKIRETKKKNSSTSLSPDPTSDNFEWGSWVSSQDTSKNSSNLASASVDDVSEESQVEPNTLIFQNFSSPSTSLSAPKDTPAVIQSINTSFLNNERVGRGNIKTVDQNQLINRIVDKLPDLSYLVD